jgi:hypothetical protein
MTMPGFPVRAGGLGDNSLVIEQSIRAAQPNGGYPEDHIIPLSQWMLSTGATPGVATNVALYRTMVATNLPILRWDAANSAGTSDVARFTFQVPGQYDPRVDQLYFIAPFRKFDTTGSAAEQATLGLQMQVRQLWPGSADPAIAANVVPDPAASPATLVASGETALSSFDAAIARLLPAKTTALAFTMLQFDLGGDKRTTGGRSTLTDALSVKPLEILSLEIGPNATVGTALTIDMAAGGLIRWVRNSSLAHRARRESLDAGALMGPASPTVSRFIE